MRAKCISIDKAKINMVLAKPVEDDQGRTLCSSGTKLSEKLLARFEKMGIESVYIETQEVITYEQYQAMKKDVEQLYAKVSPDNILYQLKEVRLERLKAMKGN